MGSLAYFFRLRTLFSNVFIAVFGYLLPSLNSAKAVINSDMEGIQEMLCYWSVFSVFVLTEFIFDTFLYKLPFYYEIKAIFILYLTMPSTQGAYKLYHNVIKPYFEKYEDHIDDGINKVTSDAQAVAVKNLQGIAWHLIMKSDKYVLDILSNAVKYVLNFDPGVSTGKNANTGTTSINVVPDNECDLAADGKDPNLGQMSNISRGCIAAAQTETARAESNEKKEDVKSLVLV